jgi:hypothetical protein
MSELLRKKYEDSVKHPNSTVKKRLKAIPNAFLNSSETSAQEAVFYILSIPVSKSSRKCEYINTAPKEERIRMLKSEKILRK